MGDRFLEQLLESSVKAKVLRLLFHHPDEWFGAYGAARRIRSDQRSARDYLEKLYAIRVVSRRTVRLSKDERKARRGKSPQKESRYGANTEFPFYEELRRFVLQSRPFTPTTLSRRVERSGNVKLALLAGTFVQDKSARADVLLVGSEFRTKRVHGLIRDLEAETGQSLRCVVMTTDQFQYRYGLFDRFVRDLVHGSNEVLIDRLGVTEA